MCQRDDVTRRRSLKLRRQVDRPLHPLFAFNPPLLFPPPFIYLCSTTSTIPTSLATIFKLLRPHHRSFTYTPAATDFYFRRPPPRPSPHTTTQVKANQIRYCDTARFDNSKSMGTTTFTPISPLTSVHHPASPLLTEDDTTPTRTLNQDPHKTNATPTFKLHNARNRSRSQAPYAGGRATAR